ncbi:MAG: nuclear transport factor 2 family protein [Acidobacteriaceae bacterium]
MDCLTKDTIQAIERIHSAWIDLEIAGEARSLLDFCAEEIEFRPPDSPSVHGRKAVLAHLVQGTAQIHSIEISDRHLRGPGNGVTLTANYKTTFSLAGDPAFKEATGSHMWELRKLAGRWLVVLVSWSEPAAKEISVPETLPQRITPTE